MDLNRITVYNDILHFHTQLLAASPELHYLALRIQSVVDHEGGMVD